MTETENKPISRKKLIEHLKNSKVDASSVPDSNWYLYATGRNTLVDILLVNIYLGEFDEDEEKAGDVDSQHHDYRPDRDYRP